MTNRYDLISSLFLEAIGLVPASLMEEIRVKGVKTDFARSYSQCLTKQYPEITAGLLDAYNQKIEFALSETLRLFAETPSTAQVKEWKDNHTRIEFDSLKEIAPAIVPETVLREVVKMPIAFLIANSKAFDEFFRRSRPYIHDFY